MERLTGQSFGHISRLSNLSPDDDKASIVVLHGQSAIVLGTLDLPHVFSFQYAAPRNASCVGKGASAEHVDFAGINENGGSVIGDHVP